ncbi:MAG: hypothetical protein AAFO94_20145, partial [Bacteroidota bacterium]
MKKTILTLVLACCFDLLLTAQQLFPQPTSVQHERWDDLQERWIPQSGAYYFEYDQLGRKVRRYYLTFNRDLQQKVVNFDHHFSYDAQGRITKDLLVDYNYREEDGV